MTEMTSVGDDRDLTEAEKGVKVTASIEAWLEIMQIERDS